MEIQFIQWINNLEKKLTILFNFEWNKIWTLNKIYTLKCLKQRRLLHFIYLKAIFIKVIKDLNENISMADYIYETNIL